MRIMPWMSSQSETQGLVVTEAMAAYLPVVAVDASGVREVIKDKVNGCLLKHENIENMIEAIVWIKKRPQAELKKIKQGCRETAKDFSMTKSVDKALAVYLSLFIQGFVRRSSENSSWSNAVNLIKTQLGLMKNFTKATTALITPENPSPEKTTEAHLPLN